MPGSFRPDVTLPALWTDRPDWLTHLRALGATGHINPAEADRLAHFAEHGWLVMSRAVDPPLIDAFVADIHSLHTYPGYYATTDFRGGRRQKLNGNQPDGLESIYDLYVNLQTSRQVCMHPSITRFLSLVFQAKVLAFQQLLFQVTNGHQWHQDPAYVVVDTSTFLAATWIALQDIEEGSGELAYYDQSHRLPHYIFSNDTKHSDGDTPDYSREMEGRLPAAPAGASSSAGKEGRRVLLGSGPGASEPSDDAAAGDAATVLCDALLSRHFHAALVL